MSVIHDLLCRPTPGELDLRQRAFDAQAHAEELEENLLKPDPEEFTIPARHVEICFERQRAAHAWRKAQTLQSQLNGAENRRYSRGLSLWMVIGFGSQILLKNGYTLDNFTTALKFIGALL